MNSDSDTIQEEFKILFGKRAIVTESGLLFAEQSSELIIGVKLELIWFSAMPAFRVKTDEQLNRSYHGHDLLFHGMMNGGVHMLC